MLAKDYCSSLLQNIQFARMHAYLLTQMSHFISIDLEAAAEHEVFAVLLQHRLKSLTIPV